MSEVNTEDQLLKELISTDLLAYAQAVFPKLIAGPFAESVAYEIQEVLEGRNDRLIIIGPPRHGKSLMTSEIAPAWFLGKYPSKKIIAASHTQPLADLMGAKVRDNMNTPIHGQVFGRIGSPRGGTKAAAGEFKTNGAGEFYAVGVGGTPIGHGADVYFIDDPIRSRSDVDSPAKREALKEWYSSAVLSRLEGQSAVILMHQRWHEDDLAGWLLKEYADDGWRVVCFPAVIENDEDKAVDYLSREIGEVLVPELHDYDKLMRLKNSMLAKDWMSMYQGRPVGDGGDEFAREMLQRLDAPVVHIGRNTNNYLLVDPADSKNKHSDFTGMAVIGLGEDNNFYILDLIREKLDLLQRAQKLIDMHRTWRPLMTGYEKYGAQADIQYIRTVQNEQNYRFPITELNNRTPKIDRIRRLIPDMSNGRWFAPEEMMKINSDGKEYEPIEVLIEEEMLKFPAGKNDDALDVISRIYDMNLIFPRNTINLQTSNNSPILSPW